MTTTKALLATLEAKPGREQDVANFLKAGLPIVQDEPATTAWFAIQFGPTTYGIFDACPTTQAGKRTSTVRSPSCSRKTPTSSPRRRTSRCWTSSRSSFPDFVSGLHPPLSADVGGCCAIGHWPGCWPLCSGTAHFPPTGAMALTWSSRLCQRWLGGVLIPEECRSHPPRLWFPRALNVACARLTRSAAYEGQLLSTRCPQVQVKWVGGV